MAKKKRASLNGPPDIYGFKSLDTETFTTGCTLLDCVLGGGWAYSRVANIIGDTSTGKTLLAIEACANFAKVNPDGKIYYIEAEAAFDKAYAESLGLPLGMVDFAEDVETVEDLFEHLEQRIGEKSLKGKKKRKGRVLYVVDSLDAISDAAEKQKKIGDSGYNLGKPKQMSTLFRRINKPLAQSNVTVMIVNQVRSKIGVAFGEKNQRAGGQAMDFYATHALWLAHIKQISKERKNVKRALGIRVRARCKKNKIGPPFRTCEFPLIFTYGIEDVRAGVEWLILVKRTDAVGLNEKEAKAFIQGLDGLSDDDYAEERKNVSEAVKEVWAEIEQEFRPKRRKYR